VSRMWGREYRCEPKRLLERVSEADRLARELLAPIYGWFTEGFDTHDLKAAHQLLESLR
jgi:hypothetical protein